MESNEGHLSCLLYNNENDKFSNINKFIGDCYTGSMNVKCIYEKQECYLYFSDLNNMDILKFDKTLWLKIQI